MDLKDELKQHEADAELLRKMAKRAQMEIYRVKAEIEAEKPKLKHWDIVVTDARIEDDFKNFIVINDGRRLIKSRANGDTDCHTTDINRFPSTILGNLKDYFDDLKALQENVTEFKKGSYKACWAPNGRLVISDSVASICIPVNYTDEFIRKLQQMWATKNRIALLKTE